MSEKKNAIVLFDGVCNFCNDSVNFIIKRDKKSYFKFAPLQSEVAVTMLDKYKINANDTDSIVLIENDRAFTHSTGALKIARNLDGFWSIFYTLIIVPKFIRDFCYKLFAKYRYKMFGKKDICMMPTPDIKERFLI